MCTNKKNNQHEYNFANYGSISEYILNFGTAFNQYYNRPFFCDDMTLLRHEKVIFCVLNHTTSIHYKEYYKYPIVHKIIFLWQIITNNNYYSYQFDEKGVWSYQLVKTLIKLSNYPYKYLTSLPLHDDLSYERISNILLPLLFEFEHETQLNYFTVLIYLLRIKKWQLSDATITDMTKRLAFKIVQKTMPNTDIDWLEQCYSLIYKYRLL